jgi:hypothetical protein
VKDKTTVSKQRLVQSQIVKLPKVELVKFDGQLSKYHEFRDSFKTSVHKNKSISAVDKMNYLKAQLSGEAKSVIAGLANTKDNYEHAIKLLEQRFGKNQLIIDAHYLKLNDLKPVADERAQQEIADILKQHLNSQEALGENVEHR